MTAEPSDRPTGTGTLTPERFAQVRAIFEAALERPARDRRGFVEGACLGDTALLREVQAMLAADAAGDPRLDRPASTPGSSAAEEGRFPAGTVLAGRYRILGRLGQGGMGEVYRAHDLILNQTVALKFLSPAHVSEAALARFRNEVRIARQVSHPNVCRVYDLGMVEGLHFLSMEYIDGEDLASLLRRIGRLPQDKAIEFTRKICAGLGAAHERGVLHRDLKPANIMIDGRGQPRITDFGLAGLAAEIPLSDLRSGTPAYMSPEQKAGKDVTVRSDLYSLGLVLHEMFTGKARKDTQSSPSELVKDLDPAIERLILRCLEDEPKRRPSSAFNVAMALPGADPIAAALAAGETPSPEMVAASQEKEGFSPRIAWLCFAIVAIFTAALPVVKGPLEITSKIPMDLTPDQLEDRARQTLTQLGYPEKRVDWVRGFAPVQTQNSPASSLQPEQRDAIVASNRPAVIAFWYLQAREPLVLRRGADRLDSLSNDRPGMMLLLSDTESHLLSLDVRPPGEEETPPPAMAPDWNALIHLAGLDPGRFHLVEPKLTPTMAFDTRMAWEGTFSEERHEKVTLEAASWRGRVVFFRGPNDWRAPLTPSPATDRISRLETLVDFVMIAPFIAILAGGSFVAWRNLRSGRGDRTGALGLAVWMTVAGILASLPRHHTASLVNEINQTVDMLSISVFWGLMCGGLYLAVEPLVRRNWPDALISWNRFQGRRFNDPLVASHILAGLTILAIGLVVQTSNALVNPAAVTSPESELGRSMFLFFQIGNAVTVGVQITFGFLLIVVFLRLVLLPIARGRLWMADLLATIPFAAPYLVLSALGKVDPPPAIFVAVLVVGTFSLVLFAVRRFGLLTAVTMAILYNILTSIPLVLPSWWSRSVLVTLAMPVALAAWALWVILSDRRQLSTESAT